MKGLVIWITGLLGTGKVTLAEKLQCRLKKRNLEPILQDGDTLRNIFREEQFTSHSYGQDTRIRLGLRYGLLCQTLSSKCFKVIISTISMFQKIYTWNKENLQNYFEVYLKVPLKELHSQGPKKIYHHYSDRLLINLAGLDIVADEPASSDVIYDFGHQIFLWKSPKKLVDAFMSILDKRSILFQSINRNNNGINLSFIREL